MRELLDYLPETIVYSSRIATETTAGVTRGGTLAIQPIMARIDGFGSAEILLGMEYADESLENLKIKALEVTFSDAGASEFIFSMMGKKSGQDAEQMRNQSILSVTMAGAFTQGSLKTLVENIVVFLQKPGATFSAKLILPEPLDADTLVMRLMMAPDSLGLTSSVSRAASGDDKP